MFTTKRFALTALLACLGLIGSACGDSDTEPAAVSDTEPAAVSDTEPAAVSDTSADVDEIAAWMLEDTPEGLTADDARCVAEVVVDEMPEGTDFAAAIVESDSVDYMTDFDLVGMDAMFDCLGNDRVALLMFAELGADNDQAACMLEAIGDDFQSIFQSLNAADGEPQSEAEMNAALALMNAGLECGLE